MSGCGVEPRRRLAVVILAMAVLVAALTACGGSGGKSNGNASGASSSSSTSSAPFRGPTSQLKPFDPNAPSGQAPPSMPKVVAFANQSDAGFFLDLQNGVKRAVEPAGWQFLSANAAGDAATNLNQVNSFIQRGVGILITAPVGANLGPAEKSALSRGIGVFSFLSGPALNVVSADQCEIGRVQGEDAAKYITSHLGGKAKVVYFNANKLSPVLIPREKCAIAAVKKAGPGVEIVADQFNTPGVATGNQLMTSILQAHPDVDVVLGDDESVLGALGAFRAAGKGSQVKYMSGVNGSADALAEVAKGNSPYKTVYSFGYGPLGYAWGQAAIAYAQGKSIPMVLYVKPIALSSKAEIDAFDADTKNPQNADLGTYVTKLGNISYETRNGYVDYSP